MKNSLRNIILVALLSIVSSAYAGGPWTQGKGKGYAKLSEWWLKFDQHYTTTGKIDPNITTGIYNTFLFAEYGFTDRFTGIINANLFGRNVMNNLVSRTTNQVIVEGDAINGLGDTDVALKYSLTKPGSSYPIAVSAQFGIPLGISAGGREGNLQTGDGEFNQMIRLDFGHGAQLFKKLNCYYAAYVGVNNRTNGFSEELQFGAEGGFSLFKGKTWVISRLIGVESFKNSSNNQEVTSTNIFANNTEFLSFGLEVNQYFTKKFGLSLGAAGAFRGEIIAAAPSYNAGIFYDFSK